MISIKEFLGPARAEAEVFVSKEGVRVMVEDWPYIDLTWDQMVDPRQLTEKFGDYKVRVFAPLMDLLAKIWNSKDAYINMAC
jgi:hypothetical protein